VYLVVEPFTVTSTVIESSVISATVTSAWMRGWPCPYGTETSRDAL
jgi:hypothetical protein